MADVSIADMAADLGSGKPEESNIYDEQIRQALESPDGTTSRRNELRQALEDAGHPAAELLKQQTPVQEAWGDMISDLALEGRAGYNKVEEIFKKFAAKWNEGKDLTYQEKITAFMHAVGFLSCDERAYRLIRKIFVNSIQGV